MNKGVISVLVAYLIWGLYPFYFHAMQHVAPAEIVIHRTLDVCAPGCLFILLKALAMDTEGGDGQTNGRSIFSVLGAHHC